MDNDAAAFEPHSLSLQQFRIFLFIEYIPDAFIEALSLYDFSYHCLNFLRRSSNRSANRRSSSRTAV
ncbi:hypothetical protein [Dysgonomonas sp. Marseille-P4677]|uniref:hypothetical protein n=1 Tax=Dysgonomonas sp. Marseille-P4677 TaxID=2364790 RepID=UPI00351C5C46